MLAHSPGVRNEEPLPLATIHEAVLEFLRNRNDAALFGAQAVMLTWMSRRMTGWDILSTPPVIWPRKLRGHLAKAFTSPHEFAKWPRERDSASINFASQRIATWRCAGRLMRFPPTQLVAEDARAHAGGIDRAKSDWPTTRGRANRKGGTDSRDLMLLLLAFPHLNPNRARCWIG